MRTAAIRTAAQRTRLNGTRLIGMGLNGNIPFHRLSHYIKTHILLNALSRRRRKVIHVSFDCAIPHLKKMCCVTKTSVKLINIAK